MVNYCKEIENEILRDCIMQANVINDELCNVDDTNRYYGYKINETNPRVTILDIIQESLNYKIILSYGIKFLLGLITFLSILSAVITIITNGNEFITVINQLLQNK